MRSDVAARQWNIDILSVCPASKAFGAAAVNLAGETQQAECLLGAQAKSLCSAEYDERMNERDFLKRYIVTSVVRFNALTIQRFNGAKQ